MMINVGIDLQYRITLHAEHFSRTPPCFSHTPQHGVSGLFEVDIVMKSKWYLSMSSIRDEGWM